MAVPSTSDPSSVLVTGANGFIAQHCVARLLSEGYSVIATVRSSSKVPSVLAAHAQHPSLSVIVVEDITSAECYLEALSSTPGLAPTAAVLHLASPFNFSVSDFEKDMMIPAVNGATAILHAAAKLPSVRRVVHTNSFAGVYDSTKGPEPNKTYTAKDWSPLTYEDGVKAPAAPVAYRASKAAAEKAAWAFVKEREGSLHFDLVSLCPGMVFGKFLPGAKPSSIRDINTSNAAVWSVVSAGQDAAIPPTRAPVWVSVSDTAAAHVKALQVPRAGNQRFLVASGVYCNQELAEVVRELAADDGNRSRVPIGKPGDRSEKEQNYKVDASETEEVLGIKWQDLKTVMSELMPQLWDIEAKGQEAASNV